MEKLKNSLAWTEAGYTLFAHEGWQRIQVERLARILQLNKSGFYHYFGDLEGFSMELIDMHKRNINIFLQEVRQIKNLDPDYLLLLSKHATTIMFQVQLTRYRGHIPFYEVSEKVDQWIDLGVRELWIDFVNIPTNAALAMRYYYIVRDMLYTRVTFQNLNYAFLHALIMDAVNIMRKIRACRFREANESLHSFVDNSV
jgi:AcrR family transcriptional regulator